MRQLICYYFQDLSTKKDEMPELDSNPSPLFEQWNLPEKDIFSLKSGECNRKKRASALFQPSAFSDRYVEVS
jgi:hypothetical protein